MNSQQNEDQNSSRIDDRALLPSQQASSAASPFFDENRIPSRSAAVRRKKTGSIKVSQDEETKDTPPNVASNSKTAASAQKVPAPVPAAEFTPRPQSTGESTSDPEATPSRKSRHQRNRATVDLTNDTGVYGLSLSAPTSPTYSPSVLLADPEHSLKNNRGYANTEGHRNCSSPKVQDATDEKPKHAQDYLGAEYRHTDSKEPIALDTAAKKADSGQCLHPSSDALMMPSGDSTANAASNLSQSAMAPLLANSGKKVVRFASHSSYAPSTYERSDSDESNSSTEDILDIDDMMSALYSSSEILSAPKSEDLDADSCLVCWMPQAETEDGVLEKALEEAVANSKLYSPHDEGKKYKKDRKGRRRGRNWAKLTPASPSPVVADRQNVEPTKEQNVEEPKQAFHRQSPSAEVYEGTARLDTAFQFPAREPAEQRASLYEPRPARDLEQDHKKSHSSMSAALHSLSTKKSEPLSDGHKRKQSLSGRLGGKLRKTFGKK